MPTETDPTDKAARFHNGKGVHGKTGMDLTIRQRKAISEYVRTGKKGASFAAAYSIKTPKNRGKMANAFFKKPKIVDALNKALKAHKFDDDFAVDSLKKIVDGGMANIDIARPDTALKALETYFKITNKIGGGNKIAIKMDVEAHAKKMDVNELWASIRELDKKQKRIQSVMKGIKVEEGEVLE